MRYHEDLQWYGGTGWMIDNRTVVTAAHNLCRSSIDNSAEHVKNVLVTIGYSGEESTKSNEIETRRGKSIAVHSGYFAQTSREYRKYDIAAIRLERPFDNVEPMRWQITPHAANEITIQVVGYPEDLPLDDENKQGEIMYSSEQKVTFDLKEQNDRLIYKLDTAGGM